MKATRALALTLLLPAAAQAQHNLDPGVAADLSLSQVVNNLAAPTAAQFLPDGRLVILEQGGDFKVWTGAGQPVTAGHIDVATTAGEQGLLGLAVDPMFTTSNRIYFYYSEQGAPSSNRHRVAWATIDAATHQVDVANRTVILQGMYGPANHNGGGIAFGLDGNLYVGVGDTGCNCGCAPGTNDQNFYPTCLTNLNGKILRVGRDGEIPATNPTANMPMVAACGAFNGGNCNGQGTLPSAGNMAAARPEIYNWGFRNPWRFGFDSQTGYLWIGDVGEVTFEEITVSKGPGEHHGWPFREGAEGGPATSCNASTPLAATCTEPVLTYSHNETPARGSASITGGVFSNHCSWPEAWRGRYWFGDYNKSRVWTVTPNQARDGITGQRTVVVTGGGVDVVHFFTGNDGAVYYVSIDEGSIHRIAPANPAPCDMTDAGGGNPDAAGDPDAAPGMDAPPANPDAAGPNPDAAGPNPDAQVAPSDAGVPAGADAGGGEAKEEGCGCTSADAGRGGALLGLLLLAGLLIRRR